MVVYSHHFTWVVSQHVISSVVCLRALYQKKEVYKNWTCQGNHMECLLQSTCNAEGNLESEAPRQRLVYFTVQCIIKRQISDKLVHKEMLSVLHTIPKKCYNVWMPQTSCGPYHIQELFFFMEREWDCVYVFHSHDLKNKRESKGTKVSWVFFISFYSLSMCLKLARDNILSSGSTWPSGNSPL